MSAVARVVLLHNADKCDARSTARTLANSLRERAEVVGTGELGDAARFAREGIDRILVLGGDGSILSVARALGDKQVPIVGINFGKLGFLAEFSVADLTDQLDAVLNDGSVVSQRMMIGAEIARSDGSTEHMLAINDLVVHAGPPYRMIALSIAVDDHHLTNFSGDGLVLATPSGSTAHNMSVGGPIVQSEVRALIVTPISPHSLTHRPLVVNGESRIEVVAQQTNAGTTIVIDGQETRPFQQGDCLTLRAAPDTFQLVRNPAQPLWYTLTKKIRWGQ